MEVIQPSPILLLTHHKLQFFLPNNAENALGQNVTHCESSRVKRYCKNPCDDCNRVDWRAGNPSAQKSVQSDFLAQKNKTETETSPDIS